MKVKHQNTPHFLSNGDFVPSNVYWNSRIRYEEKDEKNDKD